MFRSRAGATPLDEDEGAAAAASAHNAHWLDGGEASKFVGYYDAASLYPSSSKYICAPARLLPGGLAREGGRGEIPKNHLRPAPPAACPLSQSVSQSVERRTESGKGEPRKNT